MNNEIKEILDRLERIDHKEYSCGFEFADSGSFDEDCRCFEERKKMANYITNLQQENKKQKEVIDKAIEYINKYAWQEDIIGGIYTTNGKPATDRYMKLEWDNCNELLDILKGSDSNE